MACLSKKVAKVLDINLQSRVQLVLPRTTLPPEREMPKLALRPSDRILTFPRLLPFFINFGGNLRIVALEHITLFGQLLELGGSNPNQRM